MFPVVILSAVILILPAPQGDFLAEQKKFAKVRTAISEKERTVQQKLQSNGLELGNFHLLIIAYKDSDELEIYARRKTESAFRKLVTYPICSRSGELGPKRKRGDLQVPEGFYHINMFNPGSNFYLSLGISYPNTSDRRKTTAADPGGEIFIHGACVTIGCLPMTDEIIKEIYVYALHARNNGQAKIPVYIFPFKMNDMNFSAYRDRYKTNPGLIDFWINLKTGYDKFIKDRRALTITFKPNGDYNFVTPRENL
jgi:murein L,D-transpeptidase YafK